MQDHDLTLPPGVRAGVIPLHAAGQPSRCSVLFDDLVELLPPLGVGVLRYDRRAGEDVPLETQADDAEIAIETLRSAAGDPDLPVVIWGFSQGAWPTLIVGARRDDVAGLVTVGASGVSPAAQMRYTTARQLREAGFGDADLADLARLRGAAETYVRGHRDGRWFQPIIDECADRPWFPLAWIPRHVPEVAEPWEIDFDPALLLPDIHCPVLAVYGDDDRWVPIDASLEVLSRLSVLEVARISGGGHAPTVDREGGGEVIPAYRERLTDWLNRMVLLTAQR